MDKKESGKVRLVSFFILTVLIFVFYAGRLVHLQLIEGENYKKQSQRRISTVTEIKAARGEILDRYGRPLVINREGYVINIDSSIVKGQNLNSVIFNLITLFERNGEEYSSEFFINSDYEFSEGALDNSKFKNYLKKKKISSSLKATEIVNLLAEKYELSEYDDSYKLAIISILYNIETESVNGLYEFASDVDIDTVTEIKEQRDNFAGVTAEIIAVREYTDSTVGSNILGRVGKIYAEEYEVLKDEGYGYNDVLGKDGIEKTFETYLRGVNGTKQVEKDTEGRITGETVTKAPLAGNNVILTIDIQMQKYAEQLLAQKVLEIKTATAPTQSQGYDAKGAAMVVVQVKTGEILALANYPTFDIANYSKDFKSLMEDPLNPLFNRAISGTYTPGSVFKMLTATAGLCEGVINPYSTYSCYGKYTFFTDYQPSCYNGTAHGILNVSDALRHSCNGFFMDIGRQCGIDTLNKYAEYYGLGQMLGIELPGEAKGILASRAYSESQDIVWTPGNTIQASIGQSDNMFTPLQLAMYVQTIASEGTRMKPHIVKEIRSSDYSTTVKNYMPEIASSFEFPKEAIDSIKNGMRRMVLEGSGSYIFSQLSFAVSAKTGTAQVAGGSPNATYVAFAPSEDPEIAVAMVVEHGGEGSYLASAIADIMEFYIEGKKDEDSIADEGSLLK